MTGVTTDTDPATALCDAVVEMLLDTGIAGFDMDQIDERANLPAGTCRRHFHSEGEIFAALLERTASIYHAELKESRQRHPDDLAACIVDWLACVVGPIRERSQVIWALLLDPGTRATLTMYADALQVRWHRQVAATLGLPAHQVAVAWPMVEGWIGRTLLHNLPLPKPVAHTAHIQALLHAAER